MLNPINLTGVATGLQSADLNWENPNDATSWTIEVVPESVLPTGSGIEYSGTLPYHVSGTDG